LAPAVVLDPFCADRRHLRRPGWVDVAGFISLGTVAELDMSDFVRHQEGILEVRSSGFVDDDRHIGVIDRPGAV